MSSSRTKKHPAAKASQRQPLQWPYAPFENAQDVFFDQADERWAHLPYAGSNVLWTGCGLVAYTMCVDVVTGARYTPGDVYRMRRAYGIHQESQDGIFARDAYTCYAQMHRELFGVETEFLADKSPEHIARVLEDGAVVWASSREIGAPWLNADGTPQTCQYEGGHFGCIWKHEDGLFLMKDSYGPAREHNDVPYTHEQLEAWLAGTFENRYIVRAIAGA